MFLVLHQFIITIKKFHNIQSTRYIASFDYFVFLTLILYVLSKSDVDVILSIAKYITKYEWKNTFSSQEIATFRDLTTKLSYSA